jgi:Bacterial protein of unknown function (DUF885)
MLDDYAPRTEGVPDGAGAGLYPVLARAWLGTALDLSGTYVGGWSECHRIMAQMAEQAERVLPGATVREAMSYLDDHGEAAGGVGEIWQQLQRILGERVAELGGTHFDLDQAGRRAVGLSGQRRLGQRDDRRLGTVRRTADG